MSNVKALHAALFAHRYDLSPGLCYFKGEDFAGLNIEEFTFTNALGYKLWGRFYHYEITKDELIIFLHGIGAGHEAYTKEIEYFCRSGYRVFSFDTTGCGQSEGDSMIGFHQELKDLEEIMNSCFKDRKIYLTGHSMGAYTAICYAGRHKEITKVIAIAAPNSIGDLFALMEGSEDARKEAEELENALFEGYQDLSCSMSLRKSSAEFLIMQSKNDPTVPIMIGADYFQKTVSKESISYYINDDRGHNPEYTSQGVSKLNAYLAKISRMSDEKKKEAAENADWNELCDLDSEVMDVMISFLEK